MNNRKLVQHTPDVLVYFNGDTSIPGCPSCGGKIDLQPYITQVSVDLATDPSGASSSISLAVPLHVKDQFHKNAQFLLHPGLEVHIYMRGYFPVQGQYGNILPEQSGGIDIRDVVTYPYYHVFHGVLTQVDHAYSGGFQEISMTAASMLHFWQYQNMSTNASYFGARPSNSKLKQSFVGHNFTGMTPFSIVYTLFHDTAGAAGGVAYAMKDKTNVKAKSSFGGESLFSLNIRYWEERFKTRMINLRMHGASGQLFNTAQTAFLGRLSGSQVQSVLNGQWSGKTSKGSGSDILSAARTLNLVREVEDPVTKVRKVMGFDVVNAEQDGGVSGSPKGGGVPGMEINVASMEAFVEDLGQQGSFNMFESTYETKLELLNKVLEVTGWEFFQDADGDFVFKPPLYNLDTRASRVYVIQDIDIISFNFSEKEPDVTYVTCNGSQFKNLKGTGLENEWGVRGQYIDYRLVAQFGWRVGSFETSYFSNPRSMFFAAVARMDVMNIGIHSASCTIPVRPELRPGYPVYIEYLDCFYYLDSFSHSVAYGNQCSTSLTLTGKRAAFFAPGVASRVDSKGTGAGARTWPKGTSGVHSIRLMETSLPKRPLQVIGPDGFPKLVGFPNVVMALDPTAVNPLAFVAGFDLERIDNPQVLRNVINAAVTASLVNVEIVDGVEHISFLVDSWNKTDVDPAGDQARQTDTTAMPTSLQGNRVFTFDELVSVSNKYARLSSEPSKKLVTDQEKINQKVQSVTAKQLQLAEMGKEGSGATLDKLAKVSDEIKQLESEIDSLKVGISSEQDMLERALFQDPDVAYLRELLATLVPKGDEDFSKPSETTALLDLLSDKKAVFSNGQQPGFYRYYSSAHPDGDMQGQKIIITTAGEGGGSALAAQLVSNPKRVTQFVEPTRPGPDGALPEAELGMGVVVKGINIIRPFAQEVQSTDEIQTLCFATHNLDGVKVDQTVYTYGDDSFSGLSTEYRTDVGTAFKSAAVQPGETIQVTYQGIWDNFTKSWEGPGFPTTVKYRGVDYPTADTSNVGILPTGNANPEPVSAILQDILAEELFRSVQANLYSRWITATSKETDKDRKDSAAAFSKLLGTVDKKASVKLGTREKRTTNFSTSFYSPVFPVSDEGGYEVKGSYRYGRGLQIMPNSTLEQLSEVDPLQFADPKAVEDYLMVLQGKSPSVDGILTSKNEKIGLTRAEIVRTEVERKLIQSIRENPEAPDGLKANLDNSSLTGSLLSNWIERHNTGVLRLPVANAAYALGDLQIHVDKKACSCRAAQADILIEAFTTERFVKVLPPNLDAVTEFSADLMLEKSQPWKRFKEAIAGQTMAPPKGGAPKSPDAQGASGQSALDVALAAVRQARQGGSQAAAVPSPFGTRPTNQSPGEKAQEAATGEPVPEGTEYTGSGEVSEYDIPDDIYGIDDTGLLP